MIFDGHSDIWADVALRTEKGERNIIREHHLERLKKGNIGGMILVIWIDPARTNDPVARMKQIEESIKIETGYCKEDLVIVKSYEEMQKAIKDNKIYAFIGMEGLSGIGENIELLDHYYDFGARHAGLTWNEGNAIATGIRGEQNRGLTPFGKKVVKRINEKGILLDVSHLNDKSFWDTASATRAPIIATHSNCRSLCNVPRNLTDEQIKEIGRLGGLVGVNSFNEFIHENSEKRTVAMLATHAAHMAELIGAERVALGMDYCEFLDIGASFDNGVSQETQYTVGLEDASKTPNFLVELEKIGFNKEEIEGIAYKNYHRLIQQIIG